MLSEPPGADPHAGWCGRGQGKPGLYPILCGGQPEPKGEGLSLPRPFGHVRQLDQLLAETLTRAWRAGAGPGNGRLVVDVDSFIGAVHGYQKQGAGFGYTKRRGYHPLVASRSDTGEVLHVRLRKGKRTAAAACCGSPRS
jgi:Transposase DDE domain group 1